MAETRQYTLELCEVDRGFVLMALAHLASNLPVYRFWAERVAAQIDDEDETGGPKLMREMARRHRESMLAAARFDQECARAGK